VGTADGGLGDPIAAAGSHICAGRRGQRPAGESPHPPFPLRILPPYQRPGLSAGDSTRRCCKWIQRQRRRRGALRAQDVHLAQRRGVVGAAVGAAPGRGMRPMYRRGVGRRDGRRDGRRRGVLLCLGPALATPRREEAAARDRVVAFERRGRWLQRQLVKQEKPRPGKEASLWQIVADRLLCPRSRGVKPSLSAANGGTQAVQRCRVVL